jgi:dipeptidyl peptidase-like protein
MTRKTIAATSVRADPSADSAVASQLGVGEEFAILEIRAGWAWGYKRSNHLVGYVPVADLEIAEMLDELNS